MDDRPEPAVQVLGDPTLLTHVTSFMSGWPLFILEFQRGVVSRYSKTKKQWDPFPRKTGLLLHVAIAEGNTAVLEVLIKLCPVRHYRRMPRMYRSHAMRCAAYFGRLDMLKWLYQVLPRDSAWTWELLMLDNALINTNPDVELLEWVCDHCPVESVQLDSRAGIETQARAGNLKVIRFLRQRGYTLPPSAMDVAATSGHLDILLFLQEHSANAFSANTFDAVVKNGHLDVVQFLHEQRVEGCTSGAMDGAAANGFLEVAQFLHENRTEGCTAAAMDSAASNGHLEVVRFLHHHRSEGCTHKAMDGAAAHGHQEIVKFLHEFRSEGCTTEAMDQSATWNDRHGITNSYISRQQLAINRRANYYIMQGDDMASARADRPPVDPEAQTKHLQVVQFLHANQSEGCTTDAMDAAARMGYREIVKFLHENRTEGCTVDAMDNAAWQGHLDVVKFLHENRKEGCTTDAVDYAAREGHIEVVQFLLANRSEGCTTKAMDGAATGGHLDTVKYLHEHRTEGCTKKAMDDAAKHGHLDVVRFLHENRKEGCTTSAMDLAARYGHLDVIKFLHENRSEGCTAKAMAYASGIGDSLEIVQYLHEHRTEGITSRSMQSAHDYEDFDTLRFLHENRADSTLREMVADADYYANAEFIKHGCQAVPDAIPDTLLLEAVDISAYGLLSVLCAYSTKGCLVEAREQALRQRNGHRSVEVLNAYISEGIESCSLSQHSPDGPRRCQRVAYRQSRSRQGEHNQSEYAHLN